MRSLLFIIFFIAFSLCSAQGKDEYRIYVGKINGISKDSLLKEWSSYEKLGYDSRLELKNITSSEYPIEIRIYESWSLRGFLVCSRLYYDERKYSFVQGKHSALTYSLLKEKDDFELKTSVKHNDADSVFNELVMNGVFSLPNDVYDDWSLDSSRKVLTPLGLTVAERQWGSTDGIYYTILWKVGNEFSINYYSTNEETELHNYPDIDFIKRKRNIINLLTSDIKLVKKNKSL